MSPYVLVIEDVFEISELISLYLKKADIEAAVAGSAEVALEMVQDKLPDLVILDLNLPGMSGFDFLRRFREKYKPTIPVVIVSARTADEDVIEGLGIGADEFVTKPFSPRVLVARVQASLRRRAETEAAVEETIRIGDYTLLCNSCILKKDSVKIPLSNKEYEILEYMARNTGKTLSPEKIYDAVWKQQYGDLTAVAVYIQRLRKKIERDATKPRYIKTVFGSGYRLDIDEGCS